MSEKSFRIRTNVNTDKVVHVNLSQDIDFLEILSLKINQKDTYKLHVSNYGIIVGRVLANENFGIPNAKVSVFLELTDEDANNSDFFNLYPYKEIHDRDNQGRRYNLLPDESNDECYRVVGTFPNKRLVLDNDTQIEVFDKYWKYTTVTNKSGDYMIFGVPSGNQTVHVDIDLSDIGVLSQRPIDFMNKGYNISQFDNAKQFKESTNLDNLSQILTQDNSIHVYPFWGDESVEEIAITRCDVQVQYKFEPTCIFFGSIVSDNFNNNIGHKCSASKHIGYNRTLVTGEGTIEMIRKTPDGLVEEHQIQGNRLIDGDGVWCYQIPMNLDYVGTDEFGNIVPTDDAKKGIATRTSVRFRVSMQETNNEGVSRHRAKYLIPNVQKIVSGSTVDDNTRFPHIENGSKLDLCYNFGSSTPDEYFRDLYWNKVYSVKNYIPRVQTNGKKNTQNYTGIRTVNVNNDLNPVPFNHARFRIVFAYRLLCMVMSIIAYIACVINTLFSGLACLCIPLGFTKICPFRWIVPSCIRFNGGLTEDEDANVEYFPCCFKCGKAECEKPGCTKERSVDDLMDTVQQTLSQEYDIVNLDFYNDWLNGCLYFPLWFWKKTKKKKYLFGLFSKKAVNSYCSCNKHFGKLRLTQNCAFTYTDSSNANHDHLSSKGYEYKDGNNKDYRRKYHEKFPSSSPRTYYGIIKEFINKNGLKVYYYSSGVANTINYKSNNTENSYLRLFSTDIILLGSLNTCDLDDYPNVFTNLPSTTANIPFIVTIKDYADDENRDNGYVEVTGMDWEHNGKDYKPKYGSGLLMDLSCHTITTLPKSCMNVERMSELGVTLDTQEDIPNPENGNIKYSSRVADGMITRYEIKDNESRAIFASLNNNGLDEKIFNPNTGYNTYKLRYIYPTDFDGHLNESAKAYTKNSSDKTFDVKDMNYLEFKFGPKNQRFYYSSEGSDKYSFPLFNNSFYFYFGLNEGNTAIDKFNKNFYATCYKNYKYPFTFTFKTTPGKWCYDETKFSTDFGTIDVNINGIKFPYSYILYNEFKEEIFREDGMSIDNLKFGYEIDKNGGKYVKDKNSYKRNGKLKYFNSGKEVKKGDKNIFLENGPYYLEIIDAAGNSVTDRIVIEQVPISIEYKTIELGNKFYPNKSVSNDFCPSNLFGELIINDILIDGKKYKFEKLPEPKYEEPNILVYDKISVLNNNTEEKIKLTIRCIDNKEINEKEENLPSYEKLNIKSVGNDVNNIKSTNMLCTDPYVDENENSLNFHFWIPGVFEITVQQYCNDALNDNYNNVTAKVANGKPFHAFINNVPLRFILGKNEKRYEYNPRLYNENGKLLDGWFQLNNEATYEFERINKLYESTWNDFVKVSLTNNNEYFDDESVKAIIMYKIKCVFEFSKSCYVLDDYNSYMFQISHSGGKSPVIYKGFYPHYDEADDNNMPSGYGDDLGEIYLENRFPNIISFNYTKFDGHPTSVLTEKTRGYNPLIYSNNYQGNYFSVYTNNACILNSENNNCKYESIPFLANPSSNTSYNNVGEGNKKYFKSLFIDKRLDYGFIFFTPYGGNELNLGNKENETEINDWMKGRFVGYVYNGVEMKYNNQSEYKILGIKNDNLEYWVNDRDKSNDKDNGDDYGYNQTSRDYGDDSIYNLILNTDVVGKKYYKTTIKSGNQRYNIVDYMHGTDGVIKDGIEAKPFGVGYITTEYNNYPLIRGCDIVNIPANNRFTFECSSCSYDVNIGTETNENGSEIITASTSEVGGVNFNISCDNMIENQLPSLDDCAANSIYNIKFAPIKTPNPVEVKDAEFTCYELDLSFKLKRDTYNNTHKSYTLVPWLYNVRSKTDKDDVNFINDVKTMQISSSKPENIVTDICNKLNENIIKKFEVDGASEKDYILNYGKITDSFVRFGKDNFKSITKNGNLVYDDSTDFNNIVFKSGKTKIKDYEILSVAFIRNYINFNMDNLTKEIGTIQFTSIFDVRNFNLSCEEIYITEVKYMNSSSGGTESGGTESGGTESGGTESGGTKEENNASTKKKDDVDPGATGGDTLVQYVKYVIKLSDDSKFNHEFDNYNKLSARLRIDKQTINNIIIDVEPQKDENGNIIYKKDENGNPIKVSEKQIAFKTYWSGDLSGKFLTNNKRVVKINEETGEVENISYEKVNVPQSNYFNVALFIETPSKLVYKLSFRHGKDCKKSEDFWKLVWAPSENYKDE